MSDDITYVKLIEGEQLWDESVEEEIGGINYYCCQIADEGGIDVVDDSADGSNITKGGYGFVGFGVCTAMGLSTVENGDDVEPAHPGLLQSFMIPYHGQAGGYSDVDADDDGMVVSGRSPCTNDGFMVLPVCTNPTPPKLDEVTLQDGEIATSGVGTSDNTSFLTQLITFNYNPA